MQPSKIELRTTVFVAFVLLATVGRLVPHPPNFAPLSAIALFGAAFFSRRVMAVLAPLLALFLSDLFLNNTVYQQHHTGFTWFDVPSLWGYASYVLIAVMGIVILRKPTVVRVVGSAIGASLLFFLVTNFGCWPGNPLYPQNISGLAMCYAAGLPFLQGTLLGDLFYSGVLFTAYAWAQQRKTVLL
jgi:hypothetical protein